MSKKKENWDIQGAVIGNKEEFTELTVKLYELMLKFSLLATMTFQEANKEPLNILQINQVVTHEFELTKKLLSDPKVIDLISRKVEKEFEKAIT